MASGSTPDDKTPLLINTAPEADPEKSEPLLAEKDGESKLNLLQVLGFTSLHAGMSFLFGVTGGWLAYYYLPPEETKLINPAVYSLTLLLGRIFNGLLEPWIGYFSDRCSTGMGRRKPFILVASPLLGLTFALLWFMPFEPQSVAASFWFICLFVLNNFFGACVMAPYMALMPEITTNQSQRVTISAFMGIWGMVGSLFVAIVGPVDNWLVDGVDILGYNFSGLQLLCCIMAVLMTLLCWMPLLVITEKPVAPGQISDFSLWKEVYLAFSNSTFRWYIGNHSMMVMALTMWQAAFPYLCTVVLETDDGLIPRGQGETWVGILSLIVLVGSLICTPLVSYSTRRLGKRQVAMFSTLVAAVGLFLHFFITYLKDPAVGILVIMSLMAFSLSAIFILPNAIFADVVNDDEEKTGKRREGIYTGVRLLTMRVTGGFGVFLVIPLVSIGDSEENPLGIMLIYIVTAVLMLLSSFSIYRYPIRV